MQRHSLPSKHIYSTWKRVKGMPSWCLLHLQTLGLRKAGRLALWVAVLLTKSSFLRCFVQKDAEDIVKMLTELYRRQEFGEKVVNHGLCWSTFQHRNTCLTWSVYKEKFRLTVLDASFNWLVWCFGGLYKMEAFGGRSCLRPHNYQAEGRKRERGLQALLPPSRPSDFHSLSKPHLLCLSPPPKMAGNQAFNLQLVDSGKWILTKL